MADGDHDRALAVIRWPLREVLRAYRRKVTVEGLASYRFALIDWDLRVLMAGKKAGRRPHVPAYLRDLLDGDA